MVNRRIAVLGPFFESIHGLLRKTMDRGSHLWAGYRVVVGEPGVEIGLIHVHDDQIRGIVTAYSTVTRRLQGCESNIHSHFARPDRYLVYLTVPVERLSTHDRPATGREIVGARIQFVEIKGTVCIAMGVASKAIDCSRTDADVGIGYRFARVRIRNSPLDNAFTCSRSRTGDRRSWRYWKIILIPQRINELPGSLTSMSGT